MDGTQAVDPYFILYAGTAAMLVLCTGMLLFFRAYNKRLMVQQDERSRMELQYKDELLYSNIQATEEERARIARDLHDGVGASLSLLRMQIGRLPAADNTDAKSVIDGTIDQVRRIAYNLLPPALESFGLVAALHMFCEKVSADAGIRVQFDAIDEHIQFDPLTKLSVYRVLQELVNNTLKYAGATALEITIRYDDGLLAIHYLDNGQGYDPVAQLKHGGLGLKNIELRIRQLGGKVAYQVQQEGCVAVNISIPTNPLLL